jgi:hypothetical protein
MADLEGYVPTEDKPRTVEMVAGSESRLGKLVIDSLTVILGAGAAVIGKLAANDGVDIGDVTVNNTAAIRVDATQDGDVPMTLQGEAVVLGAGMAEIGKLGAGTAAIGKLAANSGVDIGDVDVTSLPTAIQGPGNPTIDSYNTAAINAAAAADQELVADPGVGKAIWVYGVFMMADTGAGTVTFQDSDDTALSGVMAVSDEGGWVLPISGNFAMPWLKCTTNKALEIDCATSTIDGIICYAIVTV